MTTDTNFLTVYQPIYSHCVLNTDLFENKKNTHNFNQLHAFTKEVIRIEC